MTETVLDNLDNVCLSAVVGSVAYGLNHEKSDTDRMGIFVAPTVEVAGLFWGSKDESWSDAGPEGDDTSYHEIGKYLRLLLKSNPTLIELLFMEEYEELSWVGEGLIDLRSKILYTDGIRNAYYGYAYSQFARVAEDGAYKFKPKMARHTLRIARQGVSLMKTGGFSVRVEDPQEYFDLTDLPFTDMLEKMLQPIEELKTCSSVLPEQADRRTVADFLRTVRYEYS